MTGTEHDSDPFIIRADPPVAHVAFEDHVNRNRITRAALKALPEVLAAAGANPEIRAIVLTGLPEVFCAGGPRDMLTVDQDPGTIVGWGFVRAIADCPLPVVAAAQGHAIGGGLLFALYADVVVLSDRSSYAANFLSYGFTPFLGATHLVPAVMGQALGTEMLYTGRPYRGRELAARGAGVNVVGHDEVVARGQAIARRIAQAPRISLELLKRDLSLPARQQALAARDREWHSHVRTLGMPEVQERIAALYPDA